MGVVCPTGDGRPVAVRVRQWKPLVAVGLLLAAWVVAATVTALVQRLRSAPQRDLVDKLRANAPAWYGMLLAHLGIAVFIVGVTLVRGYQIERDVRLDVGQSVAVAGDTYTFGGVVPQKGPNYDAMVGTITSARRQGPRRCIRRSARIVHRAR